MDTRQACLYEGVVPLSRAMETRVDWLVTVAVLVSSSFPSNQANHHQLPSNQEDTGVIAAFQRNQANSDN